MVERSRIDERCCGSGRAAGVIVQKAGLWLDFLSHCQDTILLVKNRGLGVGPRVLRSFYVEAHERSVVALGGKIGRSCEEL